MFRIEAMLRKAGAGEACRRIGVWAYRRATGHIGPIGPISPIRGTRYRGSRLDTTTTPHEIEDEGDDEYEDDFRSAPPASWPSARSR
jgi:hypothetical protein